MQERYVTALDLGSSKTALSVAKVSGRDVQVIWYSELPSEGVRRGRVFNPMRASKPIREAIEKAERELGIKIRQVVTGLPRSNMFQETASARASRVNPGSCISREETEALKNSAIDTYPLQDEKTDMLYGAVTQSFSTDDLMQACDEDIIGCTSEFIEGNFKLFIGARKAVTDLDIMFKEAGISAARKYFIPEVTANAVLTEEQKENGVALIDMGGGVTSLSIYSDNILRYYYALPFGGRDITSDIKTESGFREVLCENIKRAFGSCMPDRLANMTDKVIQVNNNETGSSRQLKVKDLAEIINARVCEILESILWLIQDSGYADRLRCGLVLTGGCANLTNLANLLKEMSGYTVELGFPRTRLFSASGVPGVFDTNAASSVGLLLAAADDWSVNCLEQAPVIQVAPAAPVAKPAPVKQSWKADKVASPAPAAKPAPEVQQPIVPEKHAAAEEPAIAEKPVITGPTVNPAAQPAAAEAPAQPAKTSTPWISITWAKIKTMVESTVGSTVENSFEKAQ